MTTTPFHKIGFMPNKSSDDFGGGPTLVEPELQFAEGTPPPQKIVAAPEPPPSNVVPFIKPRAIAAIAGANPNAIEMRNVPRDPRTINPNATMPDGVVGVALRTQLLEARVASEKAKPQTAASPAPQRATPAPQPQQPQKPVTEATPAKGIVDQAQMPKFVPAATVLGMKPVAAKVKERSAKDAPMHLDASASFEKIDYAKTTAFRKEDVEQAAKALQAQAKAE